MPFPTLEQQLQQVQADLALGNEHVARQRQIVADLEQSGQGAETARISLQETEATLAIYAAEAARLEKELTALTPQTEKAPLQPPQGDVVRGAEFGEEVAAGTGTSAASPPD